MKVQDAEFYPRVARAMENTSAETADALKHAEAIGPSAACDECGHVE